jgi:hypothetical protein
MFSTIITGSKSIKLTSITACISLLLLLVSCGLFSDPGLEHYDYHSYITYNVYPDKDTIKVGDTLWLKANFSNLFNDLDSNKKTRYSGGFDLSVGIEEVKFGISSSMPDLGSDFSPNKFIFFTVHGIYEYENVGCSVHPDLLNETYTIELGIIPKEKGLFFLEDAAGKPLTSNASIILYQNFNVTDSNRHLIPDSFPDVQKLIDNYTNDTSFPVKNRAYCFYVKE